MDRNKFNAVIPIILSSLVKRIEMEFCLSDKEAIAELYSSPLYELIEKEETKFWQYSTEKLFEMFIEQRNNGKISFPEV